MDKMQGYEFKPYKNVIAIKVNGEFKKINSDKVVIKPQEDGFISVKRKWYRGHFKLVNDGDGLTVINVYYKAKTIIIPDFLCSLLYMYFSTYYMLFQLCFVLFFHHRLKNVLVETSLSQAKAGSSFLLP